MSNKVNINIAEFNFKFGGKNIFEDVYVNMFSEMLSTFNNSPLSEEKWDNMLQEEKRLANSLWEIAEGMKAVKLLEDNRMSNSMLDMRRVVTEKIKFTYEYYYMKIFSN